MQVRFEPLGAQPRGIAGKAPERRTREYYAKSLPPEVERQAVVMKANGLTAD